MKVGDLVRDFEYPEIGLIVKIDDRAIRSSILNKKYHVLCPSGKVQIFSKQYIEESCEVVNESR